MPSPLSTVSYAVEEMLRLPYAVAYSNCLSNILSTFPHYITKTTRLQSKLLQDKKLNLSTITSTGTHH